MAFELDPGADGPAGDLATACRCLAGADLGLAEPRRPVRGERAMDAAGDRVFRDPVPWREITADAIESAVPRSEEHTSELQSLMRISYAVFCLKKKKKPHHLKTTRPPTNQ